MKNPKFSIVVPIYNTKKFLRQCIDSILALDYQEYEAILIDDGSTDGSSDIIDTYASKNHQIIALHKPNGGQSSARNLGTSIASGDYILYIDSDDWYCDKNLLKSLRTIIINQNSPDIILFPHIRYIDDRNQHIHGRLPRDIFLEQTPEKALPTLVRTDCFYCAPGMKAIKLKLLQENNLTFDESSSCEDIDWYYRVIKKAGTIAYYPTPALCYRKRKNSVSTSFSLSHFDDFFRTIEKYARLFSTVTNQNYKNALLSSIAKQYCNALVIYSRNSKKLAHRKKTIKKYSWLLRYNLNPRTKKLQLVYRILGFDIAIRCMRIIDKRQNHA